MDTSTRLQKCGNSAPSGGSCHLSYTFGALSAGLAAAAYAVGAYRDVRDPRALLTRYASKPKSAALAALAAERVKAVEVNHRKHERKAMLWRISLEAWRLR